MDDIEKIVFTNSFGTVSDKRIILNGKNGSQEIPIKQITSIAFEKKKNITLALIYFILAAIVFVNAIVLKNVPGAAVVVMMIFTLFCILIGIAYYIGNHQIKFSISGKDWKPIKVEMSKTKEGRDFYDNIRKQMFN